MESLTKILYISYSLQSFDASLGFNKKDLDKIFAINAHPDTEGVLITFVYGLECDKWLSPIHLLKKVDRIKDVKYFNSFRIVKAINTVIFDYLKDENFDAVLMRGRMSTRSAYRIACLLGDKLYFEHNSQELSEFIYLVNERRSKLSFSLKPGYFIYWLEGKVVPIRLEKYYGAKIRKKTKSGFAVTHEIATYQREIEPSYSVSVIANGVKFDKDAIHQVVRYDGTVLRMFMLLGTGASWHGVDRIVRGMSDYGGQVQIIVDIIGYASNEDKILVKKLDLEKNIKFVSPVNPEELTFKLNNYHLSFGTLGLHRKDLNEASTLKVRESLMRGYPVVLGYPDTDFLTPNELSPYLLELPSDESPIDFDEIIEFANQVLLNDYDPNKIHQIAKGIIDYKVKISQMMEFISKQG